MPVEKENKSCKTVTYKIELINSGRLMPSLLSSLAYNLAKGLHKDRCRNFKSDLECMTVNDVSLVFKCVECNKTYEKGFDEDLPKDLRINTDSVTPTLTNFVWCFKKVFIHIITWIVY